MTKTIAFQVPEELNQRLKAYLAEKGLTQKQFFLNCIHEALAENEAESTGEPAEE